jgi:hypothetical protein
MQKRGENIMSNRQMGIRVYIRMVMIIKFVTSKYLVAKSSMFPHRNIHKYTWTSPDGKSHNQIDHVLTDIEGI